MPQLTFARGRATGKYAARVSRLRSALVACGAAAVVGFIVLSLAAGSGFRAQAERTSQPLPEPSQGRCPELHPQRLPGDALARATLAALDQAPAVYRGAKLKGMRATEAILARLDDSRRGGYARVTCGRAVQNRTVVVYLEFPAMRPSASLSQGVVLVSRFAGEYRVWAQLH
jgi:hypothetical protein